MIYGFHPEALDEFDKAAAYYAERQPGLQVRFIDALLEPRSGTLFRVKSPGFLL
jgi:hypothetical protein